MSSTGADWLLGVTCTARAGALAIVLALLCASSATASSGPFAEALDSNALGLPAVHPAVLPPECEQVGPTVTCTYTSGSPEFTVPAEVTAVHVIAVGGTGGTGTGPGGHDPAPGGHGAVVSGDLSVTPGEKLVVLVAGNGSGSSGGANGGGVGTNYQGNVVSGGGGGASDVRTSRLNPATRLLVAAGGGGGGNPGDQTPEEPGVAGGAGGDAGAKGSAGTAFPATPKGTAEPGLGGSPASGAVGGAGGIGGTSAPPYTFFGCTGLSGTEARGGAGSPSGGECAGGGGGGGGGLAGGGGGGAGGAGNTPEDKEGQHQVTAGAGGGGGGSNLVPAGGTSSIDASGKPSVTISYLVPGSAKPPSVSIVTPTEGAVYSLNQVVDASFSCTEGESGPGLLPGTEGCAGTVENGLPISTSTPGVHSFTVTAKSKDTERTEQTDKYTVIRGGGGGEPEPPNTGAASGGSTTGGASGGAGPVPTAALAEMPGVAGHGLTLSAAGSTNATSYTYSLGSDGATHVTCPGRDPVLNAMVLNQVDTTASVTVTSSSGATAVASTPISYSPGNLPLVKLPIGFAAAARARSAGARAHAASTQLGEVQSLAQQCLPAAGNPSQPASAPPIHAITPGDTGPTTEFTPPGACFQEVQVGIIQGAGCFTQVDQQHPLPAAEGKILCKYLKLCSLLSQPIVRAEAARRGARAADILTEAVSEKLGDAIYYSTSPIRVDGVEIDPVNHGAIVLARSALVGPSGFLKKDSAYLISSDAVVKVAGLPVSLHVPNFSTLKEQTESGVNCIESVANEENVGCLAGLKPPQIPNWSSLLPTLDGPIELSVSPEDLGIELGEFTVPQNVLPLPLLPELPLTGTVKVTLPAEDEAKATIHVEIPHLLSDGENHSLTGSTTLSINNTSGLQLDDLDIKVPSLAQLGLAKLQKLEFIYHRANALFEGKGTVDLSEEIQGVINAAIAFEHGSFKSGHVDYTANQGSGYGPLGPGIYVDYVGADLTLNPTKLVGQTRLSIGPAVTTNGCGALGVSGTLTLEFGNPFSIDAHGEDQVLCAAFGQNASFHADSDGNVRFGEGVDYPIPDLGSVNGELVGQISTDLQSFFLAQLDGQLQASVKVHECEGPFCADLGFNASANGTISIGERQGKVVGGAGVCLSFGINFPEPVGEKHFSVGAGTSDLPHAILALGSQNLAAVASNFEILTDNCSLTPWRLLPPPAGIARAGAHAAQAGSTTIPVAAGTKMQVIGLQGSGGAPSVVLTGPAGEKLSTLEDGVTVDGDALVVRQASSGQTLIEIPNPHPGAWTLTPMPGSAPIAAVKSAVVLPAPTIRVHVSGRGPRRVLHYKLTPQPGLAVSFDEGVDGGASPIGAAHRASGAIPFTPHPGSTRARTIIARITRNGELAPSVVVGRYLPGSIRPGRPSHLRVRRAGHGWRITFTPGAFATGHLLTVRFTDGAQVLFGLVGRARSLSVPPSVDGTRPVAVEVVALRGESRGRPATLIARAARRRRR